MPNKTAELRRRRGGGGPAAAAANGQSLLPSPSPSSDESSRDDGPDVRNPTTAKEHEKVAKVVRRTELCCSSRPTGLMAALDSLDEWPWMPLLTFLVGFVTRFYRLFNPPAVVFDEHHFGRFTNQYHMGTYFFDIHPPLGKWGFLLAAKLTGYEYEYCDYTNLGTPYDLERCKFMPLRRTAALFGAVSVALVYCITRRFGGGKWAALLAAAFFNWDMLNLIESRLILTDSQLMFWMLVCLHTGLAYFDRVKEHWVAVKGSEDKKRDPEKNNRAPKRARYVWNEPERHARRMTVRDRVKWAIGLGLTCGCAVSVKWTGLATPGLVAVECWMAAFFLPDSIHLFDMLGMLASALVLYITNYAIHFSLLPRTGDGDAFMSLEFQRTLVNNTNYDPLAPKVPFLTAFWQLNKEMLYGNARIDVPHNWESKWFTWPVNQRGVLYYSNTTDSRLGYTESVYLVGNPAVLWMVLALLGMAGLYVFLYQRYRNVGWIKRWMYGGNDGEEGVKSYFRSAGYCFTAFCLNLIPYIPVTRSCFVYHYMPALLYAEILAALTVERWAGRFAPTVVKYLLLIIVTVFVFFMPWVYSTPLTAEGHERRRWLPTWN